MSELTQGALEIEPDKTYVIEIPVHLSQDCMTGILGELAQIAPRTKFIILDGGAKIAREVLG